MIKFQHFRIFLNQKLYLRLGLLYKFLVKTLYFGCEGKFEFN